MSTSLLPSHVAEETKQESKLKSIFKEFRMLLCDKRHRSTQLKLLMMFVSMLNLYFLTMFNQSKVKGDTFTIGILFGMCETLGVLFSDRLIAYIPDHFIMYASFIAIMLSSTILKLLELSQVLTYGVFLLNVLFCGVAFNTTFTILETRTAPKLLALSFEFNISFAVFSTLCTPVLA